MFRLCSVWLYVVFYSLKSPSFTCRFHVMSSASENSRTPSSGAQVMLIKFFILFSCIYCLRFPSLSDQLFIGPTLLFKCRPRCPQTSSVHSVLTCRSSPLKIKSCFRREICGRILTIISVFEEDADLYWDGWNYLVGKITVIRMATSAQFVCAIINIMDTKSSCPSVCMLHY